MIPPYPYPSVLLALRSPLCRMLSVARFSTSVVRADGFQKVSQAVPKTLSPPQPQIPYFVHRSATNNLPIYLEAKCGGTKRQTRIRKIDGNVNALRDSLIRNLRLKPEWVTINGITNHILIKGWVKSNAEKMLKDLGF